MSDSDSAWDRYKKQLEDLFPRTVKKHPIAEQVNPLNFKPVAQVVTPTHLANNHLISNGLVAGKETMEEAIRVLERQASSGIGGESQDAARLLSKVRDVYRRCYG